MTDLHGAALADRAALRSRHPELFVPDLRHRLLRIAVIAALAGLAAYAFVRLEFSFGRVGSGLSQIVHIVGLMFPPSSGDRLVTFLKALAETLAIASLGTLAAAVIAFPIGFLAAKNVVPNIFAHVAVRRSLDVIRGVDVLIWALIFINVVGLGPFAGILAIAMSDIGTFGKLFSEAIETCDKKPVEGILSTGGSHLHAVQFGMIPQVFPVIASQVLYYFESNTRSATIIGIVGAGGIGMHLVEQIRILEWDKVSFLILMILVTVAVIDSDLGQAPARGHREIGNDRVGRCGAVPLAFDGELDPLRREAGARGHDRPATRIDIDAVNDENGAARLQPQPHRVLCFDDGCNHACDGAAIVGNAEMRERAVMERASRRTGGVGESIGRQPGRRDAERIPVGVPQRFDANDRRFRLETEPPGDFAHLPASVALAISRPPACTPGVATISEKRVREPNRIGNALLLST